jgi:hypothetical protein
VFTGLFEADKDHVDLLIKAAQNAQDIYLNPPGPKSKVAAARRLIEVYQRLQSFEILAPRSKDGVLLKAVPRNSVDDAFEEISRQRGLTNATDTTQNRETPTYVPWNSDQPSHLEEIVPFSKDNLTQWTQTVADIDVRSLGNRLNSTKEKLLPASADDRPQLRLIDGKSRKFRPIGFMEMPFLMYFGNYGKVIDLVKTKQMSLLTEPGRLAILTYIIRFVAKDYGDGLYAGGTGKSGRASADELAKLILTNEDRLGMLHGKVQVISVAFQADSVQANQLEHLSPGQSMKFLIDVNALDVIKQFTDVREDFYQEPKAKSKGCQSIEWIKELMSQVPLDYKLLWAVRKMEDDRGLYRSNLTPGDLVPLENFIPADDEETKKRMVRFLGRGDGEDLLILTEDFRILAINERQRKLQQYCVAVVSAAPFVAMAFMVAGLAAIIIAAEVAPAFIGELLKGVAGSTRSASVISWVEKLVESRRWESIVAAGISVADIAIDIKHAGSLQAYVEGLKNPLEAAFFLLNLLSIKSAFRADELSKLQEEARLLEMSLKEQVSATKIDPSQAAIADDGVKGVEPVVATAGETAALNLSSARTPVAVGGQERATSARALENKLAGSGTQVKEGATAPITSEAPTVKSQPQSQPKSGASASEPKVSPPGVPSLVEDTKSQATPPTGAGGGAVAPGGITSPTSIGGGAPGGPAPPAGGGGGSGGANPNLVLLDTNIAIRRDFPGVSKMFNAQDDLRLPERLMPEVEQVSLGAVGHEYDLNIPLHPYSPPQQSLRDQVRDTFFDAAGVVGAKFDPFDTGVIYDMELVTQAEVAGAAVASNDTVLIAVALDLKLPVRCSPEKLSKAKQILKKMQDAR